MHPAGPVRRVGIVSTTRADYGIYRPLLAALRRSGREVVRFAGGTHLRREFGDTLAHLRADDFGTIVPVDYLAERDDAIGVSDSAGAALAAFGRAFAETPVDLLFLLGDRYEMLAAATAATLHRLPIAHLHGGDRTAGAYDDVMRNAVSQLAAWHFPALPQHADRLRAMEISPERIVVVGALALDELARFSPEPAADLARDLGLDLREPTAVLCLHPETLESRTPADCFAIAAAGLKVWDGSLLIIGPNADEGHRGLRSAMESLAASRPRTKLVHSLTQQRFWSCLHYARVLVGNSSAGIIEAASLHLPVVNIGRRQAGRLHGKNVLDVPWDSAEIAAAITHASQPAYRDMCRTLPNPWGDGRAAERIIAAMV